jgi:hypothetical protein
LKKITALFAVLVTSVAMLVGASVALAVAYPPYWTCTPSSAGQYTIYLGNTFQCRKQWNFITKSYYYVWVWLP